MATYDITTITIDVTKLVSGDIINCPYSGSVKSLELPKGKYKLEVWGAEGGYYSTSGGRGGFSTGIISLNNPTVAFLYSGGKPTSNTPGGFNGGGATNSFGKAGGGGSDVRLGTDSFYSRVIVAGGGGGAGYSSNYGGYGGGLTGGTGAGSNGGIGGSQTSGGTNNTAGTFGKANNNTSNGGGGGGGWYGGSSGYSASSDYAGGGGSGYVYNSTTVNNYPSGCLLNASHYLETASTLGGDTSFTSPTGSSETGHAENGYVRITVITIDKGIPLYRKKNNVWQQGQSLYKKVNGIWVKQEDITQLQNYKIILKEV